jgi:hypothetical protein
VDTVQWRTVDPSTAVVEHARRNPACAPRPAGSIKQSAPIKKPPCGGVLIGGGGGKLLRDTANRLVYIENFNQACTQKKPSSIVFDTQNDTLHSTE